ncbi:MAG: flagellar hook-length control protein FliK [Betaproteobacteria bacterium]
MSPLRDLAALSGPATAVGADQLLSALRVTPATAPPPSAHAAAPAPGASILVSEALPALARLLGDALRVAPIPLALVGEMHATPRHHGAIEPERLAATLEKAIHGETGEVGRKAIASALDMAGTARPATEATAPYMPAPPEVQDAARAAVFQRQLAWLATGECAFQFAAWPGQDAVLVFYGPSHAPSAAASPDPDLVARVDVDLPGLGLVQAILAHGERGLGVALRTDKNGAASVLEASRMALADALEDAGLRVARITVEHGSR